MKTEPYEEIIEDIKLLKTSTIILENDIRLLKNDLSYISERLNEISFHLDLDF